MDVALEMSECPRDRLLGGEGKRVGRTARRNRPFFSKKLFEGFVRDGWRWRIQKAVESYL